MDAIAGPAQCKWGCLSLQDSPIDAAELDTRFPPAQNSRDEDATGMNMERRVGSHEGQQIVRVHGPLRLEMIEPFRNVVKSVEDPALIIDLSDVPFIDSSAVAALVHAYVSRHKAGQKLALVGLNTRIRSLLHSTSVDLLFTTFESLDQAEEALA
jgi:anti-sigma B factor antagonist